MGAAFQAQEELLGGGGAIDERAPVKTIKALDVVTITAFSVTGLWLRLRESKPMDVRKEAC